MHTDKRIIKISLDDGIETTCYPGTQIRNIIKKFDALSKINSLGALVNNEMVSLTYPLEVDSKISLRTLSDSQGKRIYHNSISFLLAKAVYKCFSETKLEIKHSLYNGLFCSFNGITSKTEISNMLTEVNSYMKEMIAGELPIIRQKLYLENALSYFTARGQQDKCDLLRFQNPSKVAVHKCEDFTDLAHGVIVDNTKLLSMFKLVPYEDGFVLQFPVSEDSIQAPELKKYDRLFDIFKTYKEWGHTVGIKTAGDLNEIIVRGDYRKMVEVEEAFQEKKIAEVADAVFTRREQLKWILIAGPSSSGKTTFAHRLATQMKVDGITPVIISVDNYFVDRKKTPQNENGDYDFEHIETLDLDLLHKHLKLLDQGEEIELPVFDFIEGKQLKSGKKIRLAKNEMVLIEGIHSLNPRMTESLPATHKFKIYISALTQLNLDNNNRISTTDNRLIRRIIRDHRTRGNRALATMKMWPNVRHGEKRWIFPHQHLADLAFNSALNYELAVLKPLAEPLLAEVKPWHPQYATARRLQNFLDNFISGSLEPIPRKSILREFVGGGIIDS